jgi:hypothetical protein
VVCQQTQARQQRDDVGDLDVCEHRLVVSPVARFVVVIVDMTAPCDIR